MIELDPELDLRIDRVIQAPRARVWKAWTDPLDLARWWLPAPTQCRVERLDVVPGGAFVTSLSDDGANFDPHLDACFVVVQPGERIVFTNALDSRWRPANPTPVAMTAEITFSDDPRGTQYSVLVRHADAGSRKKHEELGFADGWGTVTAQLAAIAEAEDGRPPGDRPPSSPATSWPSAPTRAGPGDPWTSARRRSSTGGSRRGVP